MRRPDVPIGVALLDQRNLAGIGNIYRCEACFLSGVHPASPVSAVPDLPAIITDAKVLLEANLGPGRRTTVLNARGVPVGRTAGRPGYWVYRREHQPCLKCGTPVRRGVLGRAPAGARPSALDVVEERDIYFCPNCQPLAAEEGRRACRTNRDRALFRQFLPEERTALTVRRPRPYDVDMTSHLQAEPRLSRSGIPTLSTCLPSAASADTGNTASPLWPCRSRAPYWRPTTAVPTLMIFPARSICCCAAAPNGRTWDSQQVVRTGGGLNGYGDPSLLVDAGTGRILLFHAAGTRAGFFEASTGAAPDDDDVQHCDLSFSDDDGRTWRHRRITGQLKRSPAAGGAAPDTGAPAITGIFASAGQGVQIHTGPFRGRLVQQFVVLAAGEIMAASAYSDDHGENWVLGELIGAGPDGIGPNENKVAVLADGRLLLHSRATPRRLAAVSEDGGHSWGPLASCRGPARSE